MKTFPGQAVVTRLRRNTSTIESSLKYPGNLLDVLLEKGTLSSGEHTIARSKSSKSDKASDCIIKLMTRLKLNKAKVIYQYKCKFNY